MLKIRFLNTEEFRAADDARIALAKTRGADPEWLKANNTDYGWASLVEITGPGVMWFVPWYFDPADLSDENKSTRARERRDANKSGNGFLSSYYWEQWSEVRPPLSILCPNGAEWCIDQVATNGAGWQVSFAGSLAAPIDPNYPQFFQDPLTIQANPSIVVPGYHGWLGVNGVPPGHFSDPI